MEVLSWVIPAVTSALCIALLSAASVRSAPFTTRELTTAAVCAALSFGLSFIKLFGMPAGGSVTAASLAPVMLFSYIYGVRKGLIVGLAYGWLQIAQEPFVIHPVQVLLDYTLGFACVALAGAFAAFDRRAGASAGAGGENPAGGGRFDAPDGARLATARSKYPYGLLAGIVLAGAGRFACSSVAGVYFWESAWGASFAYNSVLLVDAALCLTACAAAGFSANFRRLLYGRKH